MSPVDGGQFVRIWDPCVDKANQASRPWPPDTVRLDFHDPAERDFFEMGKSYCLDFTKVP
jgi:hypothetical protein